MFKNRRIQKMIERTIADLGITSSDTTEDISRKLEEGAKKSPFIRNLLETGRDKSPLLYSLYAQAGSEKTSLTTSEQPAISDTTKFGKNGKRRIFNEYTKARRKERPFDFR